MSHSAQCHIRASSASSQKGATGCIPSCQVSHLCSDFSSRKGRHGCVSIHVIFQAQFCIFGETGSQLCSADIPCTRRQLQRALRPQKYVLVIQQTSGQIRSPSSEGTHQFGRRAPFIRVMHRYKALTQGRKVPANDSACLFVPDD